MGSSSPDNWLYDVFPSFRGEDVRKNFLSHLIKELDRKMISVFRDNKIKKGETLDPVLRKAIKDSRIVVVIFSEQYASSSWCLNELLEIINCKVELKKLVIPIFYNVDPSHVRKQINDFGKIFEKTCINKTEDEIGVWRDALTKVAELVGYHSVNWENEATLIEEIGNDLMRRLDLTSSKDFENYVGMEDHIGEMNSLLKLESDKDKKVRMVGIWGGSGIGKTTIARVLENRLSHRFTHHIFITRSFISTIRESYSGCNPYDYNMKLHLQESFLSKLLENEVIKASHLGALKEKLKHRKVLIIIDDLDDQLVLEALADKADWFGHGSIIIAIAKDLQILRGQGYESVYNVPRPSQDIAFQMLCQSAFKQNSPPDDFKEVAYEVAVRAGRLPLGLVCLGSSLAGKPKKSWEDILPTLPNGTHFAKIEVILRISYEGLERLEDKNLFRHIACFFNGCEINNIKLMLADGDQLDSFDTCLENLVDKSLVRVTTSWNNTNIVEMNFEMQQVGKSVVRQQSEVPGEREFVMNSKDVCRLLKDRSGTRKVLGISLDLDKIDKVEIHKKAFKGMSNLRFLTFYKSSFERKKEVKWILPTCFNEFSEEIRLLNWPGYPMKTMPCNFCPEYLVELRMPSSKLKNLWEKVETLKYLRVMDLSDSKDLEDIPDLSEAANLEILKLHGCSSLVKLTSSIKNLDQLTELDLTGCTKLEALPDDIMQYLVRLNLTGCSLLKEFPNISNKLEYLIANHTSFQYFSPNLSLKNLVELHMDQIKSERLWGGVKPLPSLKKLVLGSEILKELPDLSMAARLETLILNGCSSLEILPTDINLESLRCLNLNGCSKLSSFPNFASNIVRLFLNKTLIEEVPHWISNFSSLEELEMLECKKLKVISQNLFKLEDIQQVFISDCDLVEPIWTEEGEDNVNNLLMTSFTNCFIMNPETFIQRSTSEFLILPGEMPPALFTCISSESSLIMPLHRSYLSTHSFLEFKACVVVSQGSSAIDDDNHCFFLDVDVQCQFRDKHGNYFEHAEKSEMSLNQTYKYNHMIIFACNFPLSKECDQVMLTFHLPNGHKLEKCGVRLLDEYDQSIDDIQGGYESALGEQVYGLYTSDDDDEGYETALDGQNSNDDDDDYGKI